MRSLLSSSAQALEVILERLGEHTSVRHAWVLLMVAAAGPAGLDQRVLSRALTTASATRIAHALSERGWRRDEHGYRQTGAGLIESRLDPVDMRRRRLTLTAAGRQLIERLEEAAS